MEKYFDINYEFDKVSIHNTIENRLKAGGSYYICVADGNILSLVHTDSKYRKVVNNGMFAICDSGYVPLYLKLLYGIKRGQYRGADIFKDIVTSRKYSMSFIGTDSDTLSGLKSILTQWNPDVERMMFKELPYRRVEEFDYPAIASMIDEDNSKIVWIALGAPKQEVFMSLLQPYLSGSHIMIGVGAVFNFFGNPNVKITPEWLIKLKLEWLYRICQEPKKQFSKFKTALSVFPAIMAKEYKKSKNNK